MPYNYLEFEMIIIPTIFTVDAEEAKNKIAALSDVILPHGYPLERIQIDINDGTFLGEKTIDPADLNDLKNNLKLDYHLMVENPIEWIDSCLNAHADRIIGQIEHMEDQNGFLAKLIGKGVKPGLALDFGSHIYKLKPDFLEKLDVLLLMAYPAGKGGQNLNEEVYEKIEQLKNFKEKNRYNFKICLDGGVTLDNIKRIKESGVDEVAIGRLVEEDVEENVEKYYKAMY